MSADALPSAARPGSTRPSAHTLLPSVGDAVPRRGSRLTRIVARVLLRAFGWRIEGEIPNVPKAVVVGAPHTSNWDWALTVATMFALGTRLSWIGKHTLFRWPVGSLLRWLGGISVDRRASQGFVAAVVQDFNRRDKFLLAIMPQGTRSTADDWKSGYYYIARDANLPITFVAFDYGNKAIRFGPTVVPADNLQDDVSRLRAHFGGVRGKYVRQ